MVRKGKGLSSRLTDTWISTNENFALCGQRVFHVCVATLSEYPHRASLKNMPGHGGIRTYDLWNASPGILLLLCSLQSFPLGTARSLDKFTEVI